MRKSKKIALIFISGALAATCAAGMAACGKEIPLGESGASSTLVTSKSPEDLTPEDTLYAFLQKQSELQSYMITAEGTAVASLAGYKQDIHNITYKNGEDFLNQASSNSALVKMKHQSFSKGGKVVYRNSFDGEMKVADKEDYKKIYGFTADEVTLGGFIINPKTLRYAELESAVGDTLTYHFRLAGDQSVENGSATESATTGIRLQSKAYGSLDILPGYSDIDMRLTIKKDWTPVSYVSTCSYTARKIFDMSVKQTITSTYSNVNEKVEIPSVSEFNQKLGTTPSEPVIPEKIADPLMQIAAALGSTLDEENRISLPVSVGLGAFGAKKDLSGELSLKLRKEALETGDLKDAFSMRFDLSLADMPLISKLANTLTVRYQGDGLLLLMLGNRTEDKTAYLYTYPVDLSGALSSLTGEGTEGFIADMGNLFSAEKTEAGYTVSLKEEAVSKLNTAFRGLLEGFAQRIGDTHGYILSLLGANFTEVAAQLSVKTEGDAEKISALSFDLAGTLENVTAGEKIDVSLDTKLVNGAITRPFTGDLDIRLNPAAIWAGDYYAIAKAHLHLDLTPASSLIMLIGMVGGMIPDLPSWLNAELSSLDLYYTGDGILTLAFNNAAGLHMGMTEVDLKSLLSDGLPSIPGLGGEGQTGLPQFTLEVKENGIRFALGEKIVSALANAYNGLVQSLVEKATANDPTGFAEGIIGGWLGGDITGVEFFLGKTEEGKLTFDFAVYATYQNADYEEENGRFIGLTLTHKEELTVEESADLVADKAVGDLKAANEKATGYAEKLQELIDGMDVTEAGYEQYVEAVTALQNEINGQDPAVKTLMFNNSYLAEMTVGEEKSTVLLFTAEQYHNRAEAFKTAVQAIMVDSPETDWDALNALYDNAATVSTIQVPAVKESVILETAVGDNTIQTYLAKRAAHETKVAEKLTADIAEAEAEFKQAADRKGWTDALTKIVNEFKPVYDKLPEDLKETTGYLAFVKKVYIKNVEELVNVYNGLESEVHALTARSDDVSIDEILDVMKKVAEASVWGSRYDLWTSNSGPKALPWINNLKPTDLTEEEQGKVSALTETRGSFLKGAIAKEILDSYAELIKTEVETLYTTIKDCRIVAEEGGAVTWDFSNLSLDDSAKAALLEKLHGLRFMLYKALPNTEGNAIWEGDEDLKKFATTNLPQYETALAEYLADKSAPQA